MLVNVIGLGYIGLPTALVLAGSGVSVVGTDINQKIVDSLNNGQVTFEEEGLDSLFRKARGGGIRFATEYQKAEIYIIAVPTPYNAATKKVDPVYIEKAVDQVLAVAEPGAILVIESTVSPGTIDRSVRTRVAKKGLVTGRDIHIVHAPERILPGRMIYELENNCRTIGADDMAVGEKVKALYASFCKGEITLTDIRSAEMSKVVENTFRDINIAFANELAKICRFAELDVYEIIRIANKHPRVNILQPGPGVGGHCISVDPWFLVGDYAGLANIILAARQINDSMPKFVIGRIHDVMKEHNLTDVSRVGLYGLSYKEDVDDVRESPTLQLLERLEGHFCTGMQVYDPFVKTTIVNNQAHDLDSFLSSVDLVVIMVAHGEIRANLDKLKGKLVLDTKNICAFENVYKL